ncbi:hypothetical protein [Streptomyces curacoi]|nr:hypothetical protein [Streptomyces curacoi]
MRMRYGVVAALALVLGTTGCGHTHEGPVVATPAAQFHEYVSDDERAEGRAAQNALLADGSASRGDYEDAVARLRKCLARGDVRLVSHGWNPVNHQNMSLWYENPSMPEDEVAAYGDQCHAAHVVTVEQRYAEQHPPRMSGALLTEARACLSGRGITTAGGDGSLPELVHTAGPDRKRDVFECVSKGVAKLYPNKPFIVS